MVMMVSISWSGLENIQKQETEIKAFPNTKNIHQEMHNGFVYIIRMQLMYSDVHLSDYWIFHNG